MVPTLGTFWGITVSTHDVMVGAGLVVALAVFAAARYRVWRVFT